ncbi:MAG: hypothetical protein ACR2GU_04730 [Rubrobacteraceae bacterium]
MFLRIALVIMFVVLVAGCSSSSQQSGQSGGKGDKSNKKGSQSAAKSGATKSGKAMGSSLGTTAKMTGPGTNGQTMGRIGSGTTGNVGGEMLLVHQFQSGIVTNKQLIKPTSNVQVVLNADGFGNPTDKYAKYRILVRDEPLQYGGFKLFYTQDQSLLTPEQVVRLDPAPAVIEYQ